MMRMRIMATMLVIMMMLMMMMMMMISRCGMNQKKFQVLPERNQIWRSIYRA